ncbi:MAG: hypothetical protein H7Y20_11340 [Bryobacteraceae bacterium]|nr:hypothetical protein [Bryobacteraceae bacterium]
MTGFVRWLIPDLAMLTSLLTLVFVLLLFDGTQKLFRDSDAGWHIRTGEVILSGHGLPRSDPYSFSRFKQPWFAWEWGADVLSGAAHMAGGLAFVSGLYALLIATATWLWFQLNWAVGGHFLIAGAMSILMLTTSSIHWHARPHIFSWLFLLLTLLLAENPRRRLWMVACLSAAWANLHASFFLLPVLLCIYAAGHFLGPLIWNGLEQDREWRNGRWFGGAAVLAAVASLFNPYGFRVHEHIFRYLANRELLDRIGEFQSFNFHAEGAIQILLTVLIAGMGAVLALGQRKLAHFAIGALFVVLSLRSARVLPVLAMLALPLANSSITVALREYGGFHPGLRRWAIGFVRYGTNLRALDTRFSGTAWAPFAAALTFVVLSLPAVAAHAGFPAEQFPVNAAHAVAKLPIDARLLAPDMYGGYLIYRFEGTRKVWFDGRSDFYGAQFMKDYLRLVELRPGWRDQVSQFGFTHALLPGSAPLLAALETNGWKRLHSDTVATLLQAPRGLKD